MSHQVQAAEEEVLSSVLIHSEVSPVSQPRVDGVLENICAIVSSLPQKKVPVSVYLLVLLLVNIIGFLLNLDQVNRLILSEPTKVGK